MTDYGLWDRLKIKEVIENMEKHFFRMLFVYLHNILK